VRCDRQSLACILYSYHPSFFMPASGMHIVQLSHFILHACFVQHVTPSQGPLLSPGAPHRAGRAPWECQHRVCTHAAAHGEAQVILSQLIMRDSFSDTSPSLENIGVSTHDAPYMLLTDIAMPPLRQGQLCVRNGHAESGMHNVILSHLILYACFFSTSQPLRALFLPPSAPHRRPTDTSIRYLMAQQSGGRIEHVVL